jgi:hypothetical protein
MRVRWLMLVVALVAVTIVGVSWSWKMHERSKHYQIRLKGEDIRADYYKFRSRLTRLDAANTEATRKKAEWHAKQRDALKAAVVRPWLDVPRVPPPKFEPEPQPKPEPEPKAEPRYQWQRID